MLADEIDAPGRAEDPNVSGRTELFLESVSHLRRRARAESSRRNAPNATIATPSYRLMFNGVSGARDSGLTTPSTIRISPVIAKNRPEGRRRSSIIGTPRSIV